MGWQGQAVSLGSGTARGSVRELSRPSCSHSPSESSFLSGDFVGQLRARAQALIPLGFIAFGLSNISSSPSLFHDCLSVCAAPFSRSRTGDHLSCREIPCPLSFQQIIESSFHVISAFQRWQGIFFKCHRLDSVISGDFSNVFELILCHRWVE